MSKLNEKIKSIITGKAQQQPENELTTADVNFTKDDPPADQLEKQLSAEKFIEETFAPAHPPTEEQLKADPPAEEKTMNFRWSFEFVITTGIMKEAVKSTVETEVDSERVAFGLALNKIIATDKYKNSTGAPRYTQKFTKEKINHE